MTLGAAVSTALADRRFLGRPLFVHTPLFVYDGYGSVAEHLLLGLTEEGLDVRVRPSILDERGISPQALALVDRETDIPPGVPHLVFGPPSDLVGRLAALGPVIVNTMWEASVLPLGWADQLNAAAAVIVPTPFVAGVARESGVTSPVYVIPEGVHPSIYSYRHRPQRHTWTTLVVGYMNQRKHGAIALEAWQRAFSDDPRARLIFKARWDLGLNPSVQDQRILSIGQNETSRGIAHWYGRADVLLALGNEGFGLPLVEGMATGLAAIALASEGQGDTCEQAAGRLIPIKPRNWEVCNDTTYGVAGIRGVPDTDDVAAALRWLSSDRDSARDMGQRASVWVHANRDIRSKAHHVLQILERHVPHWPEGRFPTPASRRELFKPTTHSTSGPRADYYLNPPTQRGFSQPITAAVAGRDRRAVAVIYGRDLRRQEAMFDFLAALGLKPTKFSSVLPTLGSASPQIAEVVSQLLSTVQAAIVLLTPDDEANLRPGPDRQGVTAVSRYRARQNVVFEAGLALAMLPKATVFVECGDIERWSDIDGVFGVRTLGRRDTSEWRIVLRDLLQAAGCDIDDQRGDHWLRAGRALDEDPISNADGPRP